MGKRTCSLLILLIVFMVPVHVFSQIHLIGDLEGTLADTTYIIDGHLFLAPGDTLIIEAGTEFQFDGSYAFFANGCLLAVGTEEEPISFFSTDRIGEWQSILFQGATDDTSRLVYCNFMDSGTGAIYATGGSSIIIDHCTFQENSATYGAGISCSGSSPAITNCTFTDNTVVRSGAGVYSSGSQPLIENCTFINNYSTLYGGAISCYSASTAVIRGCVIHHNTSVRTGGAINVSYSSPTIENCLIYNNETDMYGGGIYLYNNSQANISGCLLYENTSGISGGAVYCSGSNPTISNCTIDNNTAVSWGGGISFYNSSRPELLNSIITNNHGMSGVYINISLPSISFCDLYGNETGPFGGTYESYLGTNILQNANGDPCDLNFNILLNPEYASPETRDYQLTETSPCIDAGNPNSEYDPDNTLRDLGCYYFEHEGGPPPPISPDVDVSGACILRFFDDHSGTTVRFDPVSPMAEADTVTTNYNGQYTLALPMGVYDIYFSREDFLPDSMQNVVLSANTIIPQMILQPQGSSGSISGVLPSGYHVFSGTITVDYDSSLIIQPGAILLFAMGAAFDVYGYLEAAGTVSDSIHFRALNPDESWNGITFYEDSADDSRLEFALINRSRYSGVQCIGSNPTIQYCTFSQNDGETGGGININSNASPVINNCLFLDNTSDMEGGAIACSFGSHSLITNCTFNNNSSASASTISIRNASPIISNCIITNSDNEYGTVSFYRCEEARMYHTLMFNCSEIPFFGDTVPDGTGLLTTTNQNGDSSDVFMNIFLDPRYSDESFLLTHSSPCINAGDPAADSDPDGSSSDLGYLPYTLTGPNLYLPCLAFAFGEVELNSSASIDFRVVNNGIDTLHITSLSFANGSHFVVDSETPVVLAPDSVSSIQVSFTPQNTGDIIDTLHIQSDDVEQSIHSIVFSGICIPENGVGETGTGLPETFEITGIYPNPFNPVATIAISIPSPGQLRVNVYNVLGQEVVELANNWNEPGYKSFTFDGQFMASGIYFVRATLAGRQSVLQRMVLMK